MLQFYNRIVNYLFPKSNNSTMLFPAVYGIRAVAVIFILLSCFGFSFAKGGSIGYSVLFVVSGYLFTESLMKGIEKENRVNLAKFYKNRAIKIFPPLVAMLLIFSIILAIFRRDLMPAFKADFLPGLLQFENWWLIFKHDNALSQNLPIRHLWALSLIVQLAIIWPLIMWALHKFLRDERMPIIVAGALAVISVAAMFLLYSPEKPEHGIMGTEARCFSFFIGAALACYTGDPRDRIWEYPVFIVDILGGISLVGLIAIMVFTGTGKIAYIGLNLLASILAACILLSAFRPSSVLARILGFAPLSSIGKASYGIYLWHFPIITLLKLENFWLLVLIDIILIGVFAVLSTRFLEGPIRRGVVEDTYRIIDGNPKTTYEKQEFKRALRRTRIVLVAILALLLVSLACILGISGKDRPSQNVSTQGDTGSHVIDEGQSDNTEDIEVPAGFADTNTLFIGDEFALNAHDTLIDNIPNNTVDIGKSRHSTSAGPIYEAYANGGWEGRIIIIALSDSGELYDSLEDVRSRMRDDQLLFVINNRGSDWEQGNNSKIESFVTEHEYTYAVDWYGASENHPEYFSTEGYGLSEEGAEVYTELIKLTVEAVLKK